MLPCSKFSSASYTVWDTKLLFSFFNFIYLFTYLFIYWKIGSKWDKRKFSRAQGFSFISAGKISSPPKWWGSNTPPTLESWMETYRTKYRHYRDSLNRWFRKCNQILIRPRFGPQTWVFLLLKGHIHFSAEIKHGIEIRISCPWFRKFNQSFDSTPTSKFDPFKRDKLT